MMFGNFIRFGEEFPSEIIDHNVFDQVISYWTSQTPIFESMFGQDFSTELKEYLYNDVCKSIDTGTKYGTVMGLNCRSYKYT